MEQPDYWQSRLFGYLELERKTENFTENYIKRSVIDLVWKNVFFIKRKKTNKITFLI